MQQINVTLTQAQVQAMNGAAVELIPSPGPNRALIPFGVEITKLGATPYAGGGLVSLYVGTVASGKVYDLVDSAAFFTSAGPVCYSAQTPGDTTQIPDPADVFDQPLNISNAAAAFTAAGGDVTLTIYYGTTRQTV